jgi:putative ABC transport system permease protein
MSRSRAMFWRILRRQIFANRGRLLVVLLALSAGAAITAALLNLQVDARRRLGTEFRAFGANVVVTAKDSLDPNGSAGRIPLTIFSAIPEENDGQLISKAAFLYAVVPVSERLELSRSLPEGIPAVVVGYIFQGRDFRDIVPAMTVANFPRSADQGGWDRNCRAGESIARKMKLELGTLISIAPHLSCRLTAVERYGGPEDNQIFVPLWLVGQLGQPVSRFNSPLRSIENPERVNLIQISVPGTPRSIEKYIASLQRQFPDVNVRGVRQFGEAQGKLYSKISGLLTATVVLVLILTALCVLAAMTNVAMERRNDVGLMKAIGGATRRVARLFLTEAALLGLAGGLFGAALGILLSMELGKAVFGVAARPRLIVYPIAVGLTVLVAIVSAYPLRRLASVRPANVFRGEA